MCLTNRSLLVRDIYRFLINAPNHHQLTRLIAQKPRQLAFNPATAPIIGDMAQIRPNVHPAVSYPSAHE